MNDLFVTTDEIAEAVNSIANPLDHLVGEGKKFKTVEDLAKGKLYSDLFVAKLEQDTKSHKDRADQIEAELATLKSRATETVNMVNNEAATPPSSNNTNVTDDKLDIDSLVDKRLASIRDTEKRQANMDMVRETLERNLGDKYVEHMNKLGDEYGKEYLLKMAQENPKAFLKLANVETSTPTSGRTTADLFSPPANAINTSAKAMQGEPVKGHKYYHELRRTDPKKFNSPEIFKERLAAITRLGDDYYKV